MDSARKFPSLIQRVEAVTVLEILTMTFSELNFQVVLVTIANTQMIQLNTVSDPDLAFDFIRVGGSATRLLSLECLFLFATRRPLEVKCKQQLEHVDKADHAKIKDTHMGAPLLQSAHSLEETEVCQIYQNQQTRSFV